MVDVEAKDGRELVYVSAPGLVSPVGLDAESACAAIRAGIASFEELPYRDNTGEPVIGAVVPHLDQDLPRAHRLLELLAPALQETLGKVQPLPFESIPLIVCLAEPDRPGGGAHLAQKFVGAIERKLDVSFHSDYSGAIVRGHTAGFRALRVARRLLDEGDILACLVCAVDSYINASSLNWLNEHWRLKTMENSDGVIPGECAAAMLVTPGPTEHAAEVCGLGFATEAATILSDKPLLGRGMADATGQALAEAAVGIHEVGFRTSDVSGESYGFKEVALAEARQMRVRREEMLPILHCAENVGDTGAAAGICQMIVASNAFTNGNAPGDISLGHSSAVSGERAAAVFRKFHSPHRTSSSPIHSSKSSSISPN